MKFFLELKFHFFYGSMDSRPDAMKIFEF